MHNTLFKSPSDYPTGFFALTTLQITESVNLARIFVNVRIMLQCSVTSQKKYR